MADRKQVNDHPSAEQLLNSIESLRLQEEEEESILQNHQVLLPPRDFNPWNPSASTSYSFTQRSSDPVGISSNPSLDPLSQSFYPGVHDLVNPSYSFRQTSFEPVGISSSPSLDPLSQIFYPDVHGHMNPSYSFTQRSFDPVGISSSPSLDPLSQSFYRPAVHGHMNPSYSFTQRSFDPVGISSSPSLDPLSQIFYPDVHGHMNPSYSFTQRSFDPVGISSSPSLDPLSQSFYRPAVHGHMNPSYSFTQRSFDPVGISASPSLDPLSESFYRPAVHGHMHPSYSFTQRSFGPVGIRSSPCLHPLSQSFYPDFHDHMNPTWVSGDVERSDLRWEANPVMNSSSPDVESPFVPARDAAGLKEILLSRDPIMIENVFNVLKGDLVEVMSCKNGSFVFQKLLDVSNRMQITEIVSIIIDKGEILTLGNHQHGSRSLKRLITTIKKEKALVLKLTSSLSPVVSRLMKNTIGRHVIDHCLRDLNYRLAGFVYREAANNCLDLGTHERAYLSLIRCIQLSINPYRDILFESVAANSACLSQDPYGNYVVQCVLGFEVPRIVGHILNLTKGHFHHLCTQKYGSHVLEKLIKSCKKEEVVLELIKSNRLGQLIRNEFGNYVIQAAIKETTGDLHRLLLMKTMQQEAALAQFHPNGKKVYKLIMEEINKLIMEEIRQRP